MRLFLGILVAYVAAVALAVAFAAGLPYRGFLHWTGELLLITGISLAAWGISKVRREWTLRPGLWDHVQAVRARTASSFWVRWNRALERWPQFAKWLHLHGHSTPARRMDGAGGVVLRKMSVSGTGTVGLEPPPVSGTTEERLAWLGKHMAEAWMQLGGLHTRHEQHASETKVMTRQEKAERSAEDQSIRDSIANLAGGGLTLQTWGVACLLAGTIMTAIW